MRFTASHSDSDLLPVLRSFEVGLGPTGCLLLDACWQNVVSAREAAVTPTLCFAQDASEDQSRVLGCATEKSCRANSGCAALELPAGQMPWSLQHETLAYPTSTVFNLTVCLSAGSQKSQGLVMTVTYLKWGRCCCVWEW